MSGQVQIKGNLLASGGGVVAGNNGNTVVEIQGIPITATPPTDGQVLTYVVADLEWKPETPSGGGPNFADAEVPTDSGDHQHFTLAHAPSPGASLILVLNGVVQQQGGGDDYTLSSLTITLANVLSGTFTMLAWYRW